MGLLDNFSFANMEKNLLGSTPEEQSKSLLSISSALRSPTGQGESAFGNVSQAILGGATERSVATKDAALQVKKDARQRANDFAGLVPSGSSFNDLGEADQLKVQNYITKNEGAYGDLFSLDFGVNSAKAPKTVSGFNIEGNETTFQWDTESKAWKPVGGGKASVEKGVEITAGMISNYTPASLQVFRTSNDFNSLVAKTTETGGEVTAGMITNYTPESIQKFRTSDDFNDLVEKTKSTGAGGTNADGTTGTANFQDSKSLEEKRVFFQAQVDAVPPTMTQTQMNSRMDIERQIFGGGTDPGRSAAAESNNKALVASWEKYDKENESALNSLPSINQSLAIINDGLYTGTLGEMAADFNKLSTSLGFAPVDANVGAEQFRVNSMKSVMDWIALTKGAISEAEMKAFSDASPGLSRTVEGNRMILTTAKKAAEWKQRRSVAYDAIYAEASKNNTIPNARKLTSQIKEWERNNKLKLPTPKEVAAAQAGNLLALGAQAQASGTPLTQKAIQRGVTQAMWNTYDQATKDLYK